MKAQLLSVAFIFLSFTIFAQSPKYSLSLYAGKATAVPDTRYFHSSFETSIRNFSDVSKDQEYSLGLMYNYKLNRWVNVSANFGYALLEQDVRVVINNRFFDISNYVLYTAQNSSYHFFQFAPQIDLSFINSKKINAGVNLLALANVSFLKSLRSGEISFKKTKIEYYSGELYPGFFVSVGPIRLDYQIRTAFDQPRDLAIDYPEKLFPDAYDPAKSRLTLRYRLWSKAMKKQIYP
jgi:hypothetical protein